MSSLCFFITWINVSFKSALFLDNYPFTYNLNTKPVFVNPESNGCFEAVFSLVTVTG